MRSSRSGVHSGGGLALLLLIVAVLAAACGAPVNVTPAAAAATGASRTSGPVVPDVGTFVAGESGATPTVARKATATRVRKATATAPSRATATRKPRATATARDGLATISEQDLPKEGRTTLALIRKGGPFPFERDGAVFQNRERLLPAHPRGYYREYTVITPGENDRGARRIVAGDGGELYYTDDHYGSFKRVVP